MNTLGPIALLRPRARRSVASVGRLAIACLSTWLVFAATAPSAARARTGTGTQTAAVHSRQNVHSQSVSGAKGGGTVGPSPAAVPSLPGAWILVES